ncbi:MAG TPA: hypothetical protein VF041_16930 [Gemmatimonadaceae bacterium]
MRRILRTVAIAAIAASASAIPVAAHAQQSDDAALLARYRLTETTLHKVIQASRNLMAAYKDPAVREELAKRENDGTPDAKTIADIGAQFDALPPAKRAINAAGLTSREYALATMSLFQASMAAALMDAKGKFQLKELPKGTPKENVDFVRAHKAELEQWRAEMKAAQEANGDEESGDEPAAAEPDTTGGAR